MKKGCSSCCCSADVRIVDMRIPLCNDRDKLYRVLEEVLKKGTKEFFCCCCCNTASGDAEEPTTSNPDDEDDCA